MTCSDIAARLTSATELVLTAHINPDGDALGAVLAMRLALQSLGKTVRVILPTTPVELYNFLPGIDSCEIAEEEATAQALPGTPILFALDCGDRGRVGAVLASSIKN